MNDSSSFDSSRYVPLEPADPVAREDGVAFHPGYGDVYHPPHGALTQARDVFLQGNDLPQRWRGKSSFTVCETGFGLGLNFLALWQAWREDPQRCARLHMVSFEAHPLTLVSLRHWLAPHAAEPGIAPLIDALLAQWPALLPGLHRLEFEGGAVTLTLAFGDARRSVSQIDARVDAYFLDGFAAKCNPELWSETLIQQLAQLASGGATLATWSSVGAVRRHLQGAGFLVDKRDGLHGKRHITVARFQGRGRAPVSAPSHVMVVGAGVAGASVAHGLARRGIAVTVLDPRPGAAHRGHRAAAVTPLVSADDNPRSRLTRAGSLRAWSLWQGFGEDVVARCGTVQLAREQGRAASADHVVSNLRFPKDWLTAIDADEASERAGIPLKRGGLFLAQGLRVNPEALLSVLLAQPGVEVLPKVVAALRPQAQGWSALGEDGTVLASAPVVVLATAASTTRLLRASGVAAALPGLDAMHTLAGEIAWVAASHLRGGPRCVVGGEGYLLPAVDGWCAAGSTYAHGAAVSEVTVAGRQTIAGKLDGLLAPQAWDTSLVEDRLQPGWAGWRAVLPGRLPAVGPVPGAPGLWAAAGYASRGLTWAALAADTIAATLCGEPLPLERDLMAMWQPR